MVGTRLYRIYRSVSSQWLALLITLSLHIYLYICKVIIGLVYQYIGSNKHLYITYICYRWYIIIHVNIRLAFHPCRPRLIDPTLGGYPNHTHNPLFTVSLLICLISDPYVYVYRLIKSHLTFYHSPYNPLTRYIFVCRHPCDALVSYVTSWWTWLQYTHYHPGIAITSLITSMLGISRWSARWTEITPHPKSLQSYSPPISIFMGHGLAA